MYIPDVNVLGINVVIKGYATLEILQGSLQT